jgi:hypothetical protein
MKSRCNKLPSLCPRNKGTDLGANTEMFVAENTGFEGGVVIKAVHASVRVPVGRIQVLQLNESFLKEWVATRGLRSRTCNLSSSNHCWCELPEHLWEQCGQLMNDYTEGRMERNCLNFIKYAHCLKLSVDHCTDVRLIDWRGREVSAVEENVNTSEEKGLKQGE